MVCSYRTNHAVSFIEEGTTLNPWDFVKAAQNKEEANWDKLYEDYDAAVDWPTVDFYKELVKKYPDMKVILTIRSAESWYESFKNTVYVSFLKAKDMTEDDPKYPFVRMCSDIPFGGALADPKQFADKEKIIKLYNDHNEEVKRIVPADRLYVMELGSGWEGLCKFLGKEVQKEPYPRSNSTKEFRQLVNGYYKYEDADAL